MRAEWTIPNMAAGERKEREKRASGREARKTDDGAPPVDWSVDLEINLFQAMRGHKPVGVNRHFQMACIHEKLNQMVNRHISVQQIWNHLDDMYDMPALHDSEILPFPNSQTEFILPDDIRNPDESFDTASPRDSDMGGAKSSRGAGTGATNTPDSSPKRKRTRQLASSSPSSPANPPSSTKRRRLQNV
ncbi:PREDICTED: MRG/MORF4L-binding protein-like [Branchiostoma belcheri]|uniref:MRG/MORF4L-binding protein-like n=1 Tax=Branchiostoma belcheri TaxID=7741 RepID=A0A6P5A2X1_BRABE|nr:PREDICTED: MRG/MORF4L-binding protein-like [Branchiostoma belcheri]